MAGALRPDRYDRAGWLLLPAGYENVNLEQARNFGGGPGVDGARRVLARAAVASLLNSQQWPDTALAQVWVYYNANLALESMNRGYILFVADFFDYYNNYGICSL